MNSAPILVNPNLGTPTRLIGTKITGTASGLTASHVTTNANLTGQVTSVGNATTVTNAAVIGKVLSGYVSGAGKVSATDNILQAIQKLNGNTTHSIGESYGGGKVFYVYDNGQHGLIAATADQSTGATYNVIDGYTMAKANGVGAGKANTAIIISNQKYELVEVTYSARICNEYSVTVGGVTYGDWYLPSSFELNLLYLQKTVVGGFGVDNYWSSTEISGEYAYLQNFSTGQQYGSGKGQEANVRAIRAF